MAQVDLCVINYNTSDKLQRLCYELYKGAADNDPELYTLRVADNGSTDDSREMLRTQPPGNIASIHYNDNIGYASAANQLAALGDSPVVGILNADVWANAWHIAGISMVFKTRPDVAILGPKQRDERGFITHGGIEGSEGSPSMRAWHMPDPKDEAYRDLEEMLTVAGSAYFVRRSVWEDLTNCPIYKKAVPSAEGAFLPTPHYYEETWCSYHARAHGYKVFYDGRISIGHSWHASHPHGSPRDRMFATSRKMFREMCDRHGIEHD